MWKRLPGVRLEVWNVGADRDRAPCMVPSNTASSRQGLCCNDVVDLVGQGMLGAAYMVACSDEPFGGRLSAQSVTRTCTPAAHCWRTVA